MDFDHISYPVCAARKVANWTAVIVLIYTKPDVSSPTMKLLLLTTLGSRLI